MIPKNSNLQKVNEYRPISIYNILYKIIIKMLTNILKLIFPSIIWPNECAFALDQLITDNILATYETL